MNKSKVKLFYTQLELEVYWLTGLTSLEELN